jgi:hypothetical protein
MTISLREYLERTTNHKQVNSVFFIFLWCSVILSLLILNIINVSFSNTIHPCSSLTVRDEVQAIIKIKVKFSVHITKNYTMMREDVYERILGFDTRRRWVVSLILRQFNPPRNESELKRAWESPEVGTDSVEKNLTRIAQICSPQSSLCNDWVILSSNSCKTCIIVLDMFFRLIPVRSLGHENRIETV